MIEVWAPLPERVRMRRPGVDDIELERSGDGWWHAEVDLADGEEYGFVLGNGDDLRPDPRSRRQPRGVHEASAYDDPATFAWTDHAWTGRQLPGGLVYELHLGTFTPPGTLDAAIGRFDHLVDLGVTHVELLPVNDFNGVWNWGYDGVLWYAVHEAYGGPAAYRRFVDAAHAAGLAVIQDVVYNHLGPSGNYLPEFGPYLRTGSRNTWGDTVNLDEPAVRAYVVENALMWMRDYHVDGLRLDAVHALLDNEPVHILQELAERTDALSAQLGRPLSLIAESDMNDPTLILPRDADGYGLMAQWSDDWHHAVHEAYGGPAAYRRFVDAAHGTGLAVIQDVVYNHLGPSGNYLPEFGPYLRTGSRNTWGDTVNLDEPAVRAYIVENALMWMRDYHVDGLRLDAVHALLDNQPVHILQELAERTDALSAQLGRPLTLIAESDMNDPTLILPREADGYGLTAQWSDDWHHAVHVALTGETTGYYEDFAALDALPKVWTHGFFHDGTYSSFRGRNHGHPIPPAIPTWRLVTFAQDHDQIGNRAAGDRLSQSLPYGRLAVAAVLTLTAPGTPMLFMGEEWGASTPWAFFTSHPEPELADAVRKGRAAEFAAMGWVESLVPDPQDPATFQRSKLDWSEAGEGDHARLLQLYRDLAALRRERPELTNPSQAALAAKSESEPLAGPDHRTFVLERKPLLVIVNLSDQPYACEVNQDDVLLLATDASIQRVDGPLVVPPDAAAIVGPPLG